jgi:hypothetical protein
MNSVRPVWYLTKMGRQYWQDSGQPKDYLSRGTASANRSRSSSSASGVKRNGGTNRHGLGTEPGF